MVLVAQRQVLQELVVEVLQVLIQFSQQSHLLVVDHQVLEILLALLG